MSVGEMKVKNKVGTATTDPRLAMIRWSSEALNVKIPSSTSLAIVL